MAQVEFAARSQALCLRSWKSMSDKTQYKLRIENQLIARLHELGTKCGYSSGNEFAADALDRFAETLAEAIIEEQKEMERYHKNQRKQILDSLRSERNQ